MEVIIGIVSGLVVAAGVVGFYLTRGWKNARKEELEVSERVRVWLVLSVLCLRHSAYEIRLRITGV